MQARRQGSFNHVNGSKYVGHWWVGLPTGFGNVTETYPNGDKYVGELKNSKRNGYGALTFRNGDNYIGQWKDNKYHGEGSMTYANGRVLEGLWENDTFKYAKKITIRY